MVNTPLIIPFLALQVQFDFKTLEFWAKIELWVATNIFNTLDLTPFHLQHACASPIGILG